MKRSLFLLLFLLICLGNVYGQSPIVKEINQLIQSDKLDEASERVEFHLSADPNNVDALMMKGNVIYCKSLNKGIRIEANTDESIFAGGIGFIGKGSPEITPRETTERVTSLWKKAVSIDPTREDIHLGICYIYSVSLMTDELIEYLPIAQKHIQSNPKLRYVMLDYARNIKDRDDFDGAIKVYKAIIALYPKHKELYSDLAVEYLYQGNAALLKKYYNKALEAPDLDEPSLENGLAFFSLTGDYDAALGTQERLAKINKVENHLFYQGLLQFARGETWKPTLKEFIEKGNKPIWIEAAEFMLSPAFSASEEDFEKLTNFQFNMGFAMLTSEAFQSKLPDSFAPFFEQADLLTRFKFYDRAITTFKHIENNGLATTSEEKMGVAYYHAWSLWDLGQKEASLKHWELLKDSEDIDFRSARAYFIGKYHLDNGDKDKAKASFALVQEEANQSKYATMCWNYYNSLK